MKETRCNMGAIIYLLAAVLLLGAIAAVVLAILSSFRNKKAPQPDMHMNLPGNDRLDELRRLVENSYLLQQEQKAGQIKLQEEVAQLKAKVSAMEKLLREVE
jgi:hypothetical protein